MKSGERAMRREIGVFLGALIAINSTIGTGIFKKPADVVRHAGSLPAAFGVWVAGAIVAVCGAISLAELAAANPRTGGLYEYLRKSYGPVVGFVFGWTKLLLLIPSAVGSFAKLGAEALASLCDLPKDARRDAMIAIAFVVATALVNVLRVRSSARLQGVVTAAKYLGVLGLAIVGCAIAPHGVVVASEAAPPFASAPTLTGFFAGLVAVMWAYDGWADLSAMAGETKDPNRTLPRALFAGAFAIGVLYVATNAGFARALGIDGLRASTTGANMAAANLVELTLGGGGRKLLSALLLVSCLGGCSSSLLTGSRIFVPMTTDGLFPSWAFGVDERRGVPVRAVVVSAALGAIYVSYRSFEQLTDGFVVGYFPFYALAVAAVIVERVRHPDAARPFRVPLYPLAPLVFLAGAIAVMIGAVYDLDAAAPFAFALVLAGVPIGVLQSRRARAQARASTR